jgi:hypothetical protein
MYFRRSLNRMLVRLTWLSVGQRELQCLLGRGMCSLNHLRGLISISFWVLGFINLLLNLRLLPLAHSLYVHRRASTVFHTR